MEGFIIVLQMKGVLRPKLKANRLVIANYKSKMVRERQSLEPLEQILQFSNFMDTVQNTQFQKTELKLEEKHGQKVRFQQIENRPPSVQGGLKNSRAVSHGAADPSPMSKSKYMSQASFNIKSHKKVTIKPQGEGGQRQKTGRMKEEDQNPLSLIVQILKGKYIITQNHLSSYNIKKDSLVSLLSYLVSCLSARHKTELQQAHTYHQNLSFIREQMNTLVNMAKASLLKESAEYCSLQSNKSKFNYTQQDYQSELKPRRNELARAYKEKQTCAKDIAERRGERDYIINEIILNKKVIEDQLRQKMNLDKIIAEQQQQHRQLSEEIAAMKLQASTLQIESKKIENFIQDQTNNQIVKIMGEEYQKIQSEIYDWAVYCQSNQLAHDINFQPQPYKMLEDHIDRELRSVNKSLIQNEELNFDQKCRCMRDFVLKAMDFYKKKDEEMTKVTDFKTMCIRTFIERMQKWVNNWELKQDYLVRLRKESVIVFGRIRAGIGRLKNLKVCPQCRFIMGEIGGELEGLFEKMEENYKFGNSFY